MGAFQIGPETRCFPFAFPSDTIQRSLKSCDRQSLRPSGPSRTTLQQAPAACRTASAGTGGDLLRQALRRLSNQHKCPALPCRKAQRKHITGSHVNSKAVAPRAREQFRRKVRHLVALSLLRPLFAHLGSKSPNAKSEIPTAEATNRNSRRRLLFRTRDLAAVSDLQNSSDGQSGGSAWGLHN